MPYSWCEDPSSFCGTRDGLALFSKRLERGSFETLAPQGDAATVELDAAQLAMILSGISLASAKRRKRYRRAG